MLALCMVWGGKASAETFGEFDVPGAGGTFPLAINAGGAITGYYTVQRRNSYGFVRLPDGTLTTFGVPDAQQTFPAAINDNGYIPGSYWRHSSGLPRGFLRYPDGTITTFGVPQSQRTDVYDVNAGAIIVGSWADTYGTHGFLREPDGSFITFDVPGAKGTDPRSINAPGAIAGSAGPAFIRNPDGSFIQFAVPRAYETFPNAIDDKGRVAGVIERRRGELAFVREPNGKLIRFAAPDAKYTDARDVVAGKGGVFTVVGIARYSDAYSVGFLRTSDGTISTFEAPGAGTAAGQGTFPLSINGQQSVAGYYTDSNYVSHGFVRAP